MDGAKVVEYPGLDVVELDDSHLSHPESVSQSCGHARVGSDNGERSAGEIAFALVIRRIGNGGG